MATNELQLAKAFRDAGFEQDKAEAVSETIFAAIRDNVATKADLAGVEQALRSDLRVLGAELRQEIAVLKWMVGGVYAVLVVFGVPALWLLLRTAAKVGVVG